MDVPHGTGEDGRVCSGSIAREDNTPAEEGVSSERGSTEYTV